MTTKPVWTVDQSIDALDLDQQWTSPVISYSMTGIARANENDHNVALGIVPMGSFEQGFAAAAFELWDQLIAVDLVPSNDPNADIVLNYSAAPNTLTGNPGAQRFPIGAPVVKQSDIWIPDTSDAHVLSFGSHQFSTFIHEIGHSLGLYHPGPYNGESADYDRDVTHAQDSIQFTIMSYFHERHYESGANYLLNGVQIEPQTPMLHDVAAIQAIYGADTTTHLGDTVYGFNSTFLSAGADMVFNFSSNAVPLLTIYDAGGNDTFDVSGFTQTQVIDLEPGHYSSVGGLTKNVAMAFNTMQVTQPTPGIQSFNPHAVIENAVGGSGRDTIYGNQAGNTLEGRDGEDELWGQGGNDILVGGAGEDWMYGGADNDIYWVDTERDHVVEVRTSFLEIFSSDQGGTDTVYSMAYHFELPEAVEHLTLWSGVNGTGNGLFNIITGNGDGNRLDGRGGNDWLSGEGGADWLIGGEGGDGMDGGEGKDQFVVDNGGEIGGDVVVGGSEDDEVWADSSVAATGLNLKLFATGTPITAEVNRTVGTSAAMDVELVHGSSVGNDMIDASLLTDESVLVDGYGGDDIFVSGRDWDIFDGGADTDTIVYLDDASNYRTKGTDKVDWFIIEDVRTGLFDMVHEVEYVRFNGLDGVDVRITDTNTPPEVTVADRSVNQNEWQKVTDWFTVSDAENHAITNYRFGDDGADATSGFFWTPEHGVVAANTTFTVDAADLGNVWFVGGQVAGTERLWVQAGDGEDWSAFYPFNVTTVVNTAPQATVEDKAVATGGSLAASSLVSASDADGDSIASYRFWDASDDTASGHFVVNGVVQGASQMIEVEAADLAQATFEAGSTADQLWVQVSDGSAWSDWQSFNVTIAASALPPVVPGQTLIGTSNGDDLRGGDGNDRLEGRDGMDFLTGGAGADELLGGAGMDFIYVDAEDTLIDGGDGFDYLYLDSSKSYGADFNAAGKKVEYVGGTLKGDRIDASGMTTQIVVNGNHGNDVIIGGSGHDRIDGSADDDTLTGGLGNDTFLFAGRWGSDTITDFTLGQDVLNVTGVSGLTDRSQLTIEGTAQGASITFGTDSILLEGVDAGSLMNQPGFLLLA